MKIQMAQICDAANVSQQGKLNLLGVFDRISSQQFPTVHPSLCFVLRLEAEYVDAAREFPLRVRLVDEDGQEMFKAEAALVGPGVGPGEFVTANQVFHLVGLKFERPGMYRFLVEVGDARFETPLAVVQAGGVPQASRAH